jgi:dTDP-4-dehydrorhamnose reductase
VSSKNTNFGLYHYSNEGMVSWYDFAKAIFEVSAIEIKLNPIKTVDYPTPANRPAYSVMDKAKIKSRLSTQASFWIESLQKAIKVTVLRNTYHD